ncbi:5'/3'-nucleotidase SurE [Silicimonas algicola]|uniref:5'-nucleotidase SurE n=1 Tax=Silicimonas algicola TaxID=1826607 RepID=A0A316GDJ2_9RHOB|nr:5'/3'-nucleotidase SurE [Silicimonas algicola]AZQ66446.1 5'/3'-nucleotidase SurE [Silicimonas algicola]PWK58782.1 5'-nucleotidase /3'-nucleotidase /exopolyphosphatase [Silicimonas algicola]
MRILITNDDGINAPGLETLAAIAHEVSGPDGEVWTVAPAFEQSGVGHCISYTHPTMLSKFGERRYAAEGSPADCVLAGIHEVLKDTKPDLILSGVNRGNNAAENVLYSGTIGGAMEGALQGIPSIALSQFYGPGNASLDNPFESAAVHGVRTVRAILDQGIWETRGYQVFYNVNFPPCTADETRDIRITTQGWRDKTTMGVEPHLSPSGRMFLWVRGGPQHHPTGEGTDVTANIDGYISVTPLRADLTAYDLIADLRGRFDG